MGRWGEGTRGVWFSAYWNCVINYIQRRYYVAFYFGGTSSQRALTALNNSVNGCRVRIQSELNVCSYGTLVGLNLHRESKFFVLCWLFGAPSTNSISIKYNLPSSSKKCGAGRISSSIRSVFHIVFLTTSTRKVQCVILLIFPSMFLVFYNQPILVSLPLAIRVNYPNMFLWILVMFISSKTYLMVRWSEYNFRYIDIHSELFAFASFFLDGPSICHVCIRNLKRWRVK